MDALTEIFRTFGPAYLTRFPQLPANHRKVIHAVIACRSAGLGSIVYRCPDCHGVHFISRSCGNRHCPQCQAHKTRLWLERQVSRRVPGTHFLITFTVPEPLRVFLRGHQRVGYRALFAASSEAIKGLARDPRHLGSDLPGFTGVLHTWGRQLQYHTHVHYIVPGGGLAPERDRWLASRETFFLPVRPLSRLFRGKFKARMQRAGLLDAIDPRVWSTDWVVHSKPVGDGEHAFRYLATYVFRVAISSHRIVSFSEADHSVVFRYTDRQTGQERLQRLDAFEFLRRFLQHVLPTGFMKVRHFGFLHPNCAVPLDQVRRLVAEATHQPVPKTAAPVEKPVFPCPDCGAPMVFVRTILGPLCRPMLDTG